MQIFLISRTGLRDNTTRQLCHAVDEKMIH